MANDLKSIKSPLQMVGFYLAWIETVLAASFWPLKGHDKLLNVLFYTVIAIALIFAGAMIFILLYLVLKSPRWLFNPSDYDPDVQDELFKHDHSLSNGDLISINSSVKAGDINEQC